MVISRCGFFQKAGGSRPVPLYILSFRRAAFKKRTKNLSFSRAKDQAGQLIDA
jgi:hypothetical protein